MVLQLQNISIKDRVFEFIAQLKFFIYKLYVLEGNGTTYIHKLQLLSQDYNLGSHITDVVCVNFIHK